MIWVGPPPQSRQKFELVAGSERFSERDIRLPFLGLLKKEANRAKEGFSHYLLNAIRSPGCRSPSGAGRFFWGVLGGLPAFAPAQHFGEFPGNAIRGKRAAAHKLARPFQPPNRCTAK